MYISCVSATQEAHKRLVPGEKDIFQCGYCQKVHRIVLAGGTCIERCVYLLKKGSQGVETRTRQENDLATIQGGHKKPRMVNGIRGLRFVQGVELRGRTAALLSLRACCELGLAGASCLFAVPALPPPARSSSTSLARGGGWRVFL